MEITQLIKEAKHGSAAAQKCLFDIYYNRLRVICSRYVKNRLDAEELVLNAYYKFFKSLHSFNYKDESTLYQWLKKIMINECLMFLRKNKGFSMVAEIVTEDISLEDEVLDILSAREIFNLIVQLPVGYRTVFNLYAIEGMGHDEIGKCLGISKGTSKSQLSKAKSALQKMLIAKEDMYATRKTFK